MKSTSLNINTPLFPLGFGVMRLPMNRDGTFPHSVYALISEAYERGINYFDTAYPYLGGHSEELIRDALVKRYPRESFYIADKLPPWECRRHEDMERVFNIQLKRLGVEYIDYYLIHGLHSSRWIYMKEMGVLDFLNEKRAQGKIRKVGFSFHDTADVLSAILDAYDWDFAQLQINYYDWVIQRAKESYDILAERGIPCMVMEPVGGGRLAALPKEAEKLLKAQRPEDSAASWAIRFSAKLPNVAVTLSGMNTTAQLMDNLSVFEGGVSVFSEAEQAAIQGVVKILRAQNTIPCTACGYCAGECPNNVDIPQIFKRYNDTVQFEIMDRLDVQYFVFVPEKRRADRCISCGKCTRMCPQNIDIPGELKKIHDRAVSLARGK